MVLVSMSFQELRLDRMSRSFGTFNALREINLTIRKGEFIALLGPSGCGKSTALNCIAGLLGTTSGGIYIDERRVDQLKPEDRGFGMVFQNYALFPHMNVLQNVGFGLKMRGLAKSEIEKRARAALALVRLQGQEEKLPGQLSGGQQQRVAIARALVFEPDLLLLDEPLAALDRKLREEMQLEFRRIQRELGVTTINVTHDQREALVVSDEIIVMDGGEIQQMAQPSETYRNPSNAFVANFIGVTNFISGKASSLDGNLVRVDAGMALVGMAGEGRGPVAANANVSCAIRAEQIRIGGSAAAHAELDTVLEGIVTDAIFEGERIVYELRVPALGDVLMRVFDHDPIGHSQFAEGETVHLGWNARDLIVFAV